MDSEVPYVYFYDIGTSTMIATLEPGGGLNPAGKWGRRDIFPPDSNCHRALNELPGH